MYTTFLDLESELFLSAADDGAGDLIADAGSPSTWESFMLTQESDGSFLLLSQVSQSTPFPPLFHLSSTSLPLLFYLSSTSLLPLFHFSSTLFHSLPPLYHCEYKSDYNPMKKMPVCRSSRFLANKDNRFFFRSDFISISSNLSSLFICYYYN
jgi:hypothetical protein